MASVNGFRVAGALAAAVLAVAPLLPPAHVQSVSGVRGSVTVTQ